MDRFDYVFLCVCLVVVFGLIIFITWWSLNVLADYFRVPFAALAAALLLYVLWWNPPKIDYKRDNK